MRALDLTGCRFGRLTVVEFVTSAKKRRRWKCVCDCGATLTSTTSDLRTGNTRSCGCYQVERASEANLKHGHSRYHRGEDSAEYRCWMQMIQRCTNPSIRNFHNYGGRGVRVCDRWRHSFEAFLQDMGPKPDPKLSIDRINVNGHYEPGNCRWTTASVQARNRRPPHELKNPPKIF